MAIQMKFLMTLLVGLLIFANGAFATNTCYSCTTGQPEDIVFAVAIGFKGDALANLQSVPQCAGAVTQLGSSYQVTNCQSPCLEMSIQTGGKSIYVRGCQQTLTGANSAARTCEGGSVDIPEIGSAKVQLVLCNSDLCNKDYSSSYGLSAGCTGDNQQTACYQCADEVSDCDGTASGCKSRYCISTDAYISQGDKRLSAKTCVPVNLFGGDQCMKQSISDPGVQTNVCYCSEANCNAKNCLGDGCKPPTLGGANFQCSAFLLFSLVLLALFKNFA